MTDDDRMALLSDKEIEQQYPKSAQAQAIRDARAADLKRLMLTAPHWRAVNPNATKAERDAALAASDAELDAKIAESIARIHTNVDRHRVVTERQRQHDVAAD